MSDEQTETVEDVVAEMERQHADIEKDQIERGTWDDGYCVSAGAYARRLRAALGRSTQ